MRTKNAGAGIAFLLALSAGMITTIAAQPQPAASDIHLSKTFIIERTGGGWNCFLDSRPLSETEFLDKCGLAERSGSIKRRELARGIMIPAGLAVAGLGFLGYCASYLPEGKPGRGTAPSAIACASGLAMIVIPLSLSPPHVSYDEATRIAQEYDRKQHIQPSRDQ
ncbi:hypothetical protein EG831_03075 [bacterium]|nr:hypothetical protein [bacterium]